MEIYERFHRKQIFHMSYLRNLPGAVPFSDMLHTTKHAGKTRVALTSLPNNHAVRSQLPPNGKLLKYAVIVVLFLLSQIE